MRDTIKYPGGGMDLRLNQHIFFTMIQYINIYLQLYHLNDRVAVLTILAPKYLPSIIIYIILVKLLVFMRENVLRNFIFVWSFLSVLAAIFDFAHFGHFLKKSGRHYQIFGGKFSLEPTSNIKWTPFPYERLYQAVLHQPLKRKLHSISVRYQFDGSDWASP